MNILKEKREDVIKNNNTAEDTFKYLLRQISTETEEIIITEKLYGNLDFSILKEFGYKRVKTIELSEGEITNVSNLPNGLERFICNNNMLYTLDNIPTSIVELRLKKNYINEINIENLDNLKILDLEENKLTHFEVVPPHIEELYLQNNAIVHLNLKEATRLRILNVSNNKTIILENIPPSIVDLQSENNPYIELNYINSREQDGKKKGAIKPIEDHTLHAEKISDFKTALHKYFDMKTRYEEINHKERTKLKKKYPLQKKKRIYVPKCIHCKRVGGTIFEKKNSVYIAMCGITADPCSLKIEIDAGVNYNIDQFIQIEETELNKNKTVILKEKMNSIYGYSSKEEIARSFKKAISEYQFDSEEYLGLVEKHNQLYYDKAREDQILRKQKQIMDLKQAIKTLVTEYSKTQNPDLLSNAINIQIKELNPEIHNLRLLKYEIMEMKGVTQTVMSGQTRTPAVHEVDVDGGETSKGEKTTIKQNINTLFQRYSGLPKMEHLVGQEPYVKSFNK